MERTEATEVIVFDLDGTLVDSKEFMILSFTTTLTAHGFSFPSWEDFLSKCRGMGLKDVYQILTGLSDANFLCKEHRKWQAENKEMVKLFPHIHETLVKIRTKGLLIALATNRSAGAEEELRRLQISEFFSTIRHLGNTPREFQKPHPRMIHVVSEELSVDTNRIIMVGDMDDDVKAGKAARVQKVVGTSYGFYGHRITEHEPDHVIHSFPEILDFLE